MSLLDMMLADRRILLALAAALAPLALAALLGVALQVRRLAQRRAARRAEDDVFALAAMGLADEPADQPADPRAAAGVSPAHEVSDAEAAPDDEPEAAPDGENDAPGSAIQSLLDSVFTDEAETNRLAHLLDELDDIPAADLAALCESVAGRLS